MAAFHAKRMQESVRTRGVGQYWDDGQSRYNNEFFDSFFLQKLWFLRFYFLTCQIISPFCSMIIHQSKAKFALSATQPQCQNLLIHHSAQWSSNWSVQLGEQKDCPWVWKGWRLTLRCIYLNIFFWELDIDKLSNLSLFKHHMWLCMQFINYNL